MGGEYRLLLHEEAPMRARRNVKIRLLNVSLGLFRADDSAVSDLYYFKEKYGGEEKKQPIKRDEAR